MSDSPRLRPNLYDHIVSARTEISALEKMQKLLLDVHRKAQKKNELDIDDAKSEDSDAFLNLCLDIEADKRLLDELDECKVKNLQERIINIDLGNCRLSIQYDSTLYWRLVAAVTYRLTRKNIILSSIKVIILLIYNITTIFISHLFTLS